MIVSFRHKGLKRFFVSGDTRGINAEHRTKILAILTALDEARSLEDLGIPGFKTHPLAGSLQGLWAVTVRANWRVTFRFENGSAYDVDLVDYH